MKTRIYFPIEIYRREFLSRIIFALKAANRGFSVVIGTKVELYSKLNILRPGHYILKSVQHNLINFVKGLKKKNFKISAIDEEGLMHYDDQYYLRRYGENTINEIDNYFFCWGAKDMKLIKSKFPQLENKISIAGNSRINILNKKYEELYKEEVSAIKKKFGEFFLVSTKFGKINFLPREGYNEYVKGQIDRGYVTNEYTLNIAKQAKEHEKKNYELYFKFFKLFSEKLPNQKLVVLPHPGENYDTYRKILKEYKNIELSTGEFSTESMLLATKCNISCNCTTSVESYYLGKVPINFIPFVNENVEYSFPKIVSKNINDANELIKFLHNFDESENSDFLNELDKKQIEENIANIDTEEKIIEKLGEYKIKNNNIFNMSLFSKYYFLKRFVVENLIPKKLINDPSKALKDQKNPKISKKELELISNQFLKLTNLKKPNIKEIYPGIFEFTC